MAQYQFVLGFHSAMVAGCGGETSSIAEFGDSSAWKERFSISLALGNYSDPGVLDSLILKTEDLSGKKNPVKFNSCKGL